MTFSLSNPLIELAHQLADASAEVIRG